jgi:putative SOS response-associated peptidase YedK
MRRWGLVPSWAKDPSFGARTINARSETAAEKPAFRAAMRSRRCLVPVDGFYEWTAAEDGGRQPWHVRRRDGTPFALAGLYEHWGAGERTIESFTILTTEANEVLRPLHDRMPVVVAPADFAAWLDPETKDAGRVKPLLRPAPPEAMEAVRVSRWVNDARHDDARCVVPA